MCAYIHIFFFDTSCSSHTSKAHHENYPVRYWEKPQFSHVAHAKVRALHPQRMHHVQLPWDKRSSFQSD